MSDQKRQKLDPSVKSLGKMSMDDAFETSQSNSKADNRPRVNFDDSELRTDDYIVEQQPPPKAPEKYKTPRQKQYMKDEDVEGKVDRVIAQFKSTTGTTAGPSLDLSSDITTTQLEQLLNDVLQNEDPLPYSFYVNEEEITESLAATIKSQKMSTEATIGISFVPQALFRVRMVQRCTATLPGHAAPIIVVSFSPDGQGLATGSGDSTVRLWDLNTQTPVHTLEGHRAWILCIAWSPDAKKIAVGDKVGGLRLWEPETGKQLGKEMRGHSKWITGISWEPFHRNPKCDRMVTSSKDGHIKIWDTNRRICTMTLSGHGNHSVTCVRWGGEGLIYSGSQDRSVKVWEASSGKLVRSLAGHAHWINTMALSTDAVLKSGIWDHTKQSALLTHDEAIDRYNQATADNAERLATGSDDFTLFLWDPTQTKKPMCRMTGHQALVNQVAFSPDGQLLASASFDKSVKLWSGRTGKFVASLRGHVGPVYQIAWSSDSRMLVSGSKDSTMKVWDLKTHKIKSDLPGHSDEVYSVDWSPDGAVVASGSKDTNLKLWKA